MGNTITARNWTPGLQNRERERCHSSTSTNLHAENILLKAFLSSRSFHLWLPFFPYLNPELGDHRVSTPIMLYCRHVMLRALLWGWLMVPCSGKISGASKPSWSAGCVRGLWHYRSGQFWQVKYFTIAFDCLNFNHFTQIYYSATGKPVTTWNMSGMFIVLWPITAKIRTRGLATKPQTTD